MPKRTKGRKRSRSRAPKTPSLDNGLNVLSTPRPTRPTKRTPTDIETTAIRVADLTDRIGHSRSYLNSLAENTSAERANLARLMLEHGEAVTKMRELAQIPQPVV